MEPSLLLVMTPAGDHNTPSYMILLYVPSYNTLTYKCILSYLPSYTYPHPTSCEVVVLEHGVKYYVQPEDGQKTGFYADQRDNRHRIRLLSHNNTVLDTFCYSGGLPPPPPLPPSYTDHTFSILTTPSPYHNTHTHIIMLAILSACLGLGG